MYLREKHKERIYRSRTGDNDLVSSLAARKLGTGAHETVRIWMRGAYVGELIVGEGDAARLGDMLGLVDVGEAVGGQ